MLRERYDNVVVDLSPLTPVVDVRATEQLIDAYMLVVEWGRTRIDQVERALRDAQGLQDHVRNIQNGTSYRDVLANFLGSDEYYLRKGNTPDGFITGLYRDVPPGRRHFGIARS